ncbi:MAG: exo-alpha-sialidase [Clostridia bacterium]|nr:exo-alpha-sialidase [Clostridia bacterium]
MNITVQKIREGYDGKRCLVHARMCAAPDKWIATAQYLDVTGCDLFDGIKLSISRDEGKTWTPFADQPGLAPIRRPDGSIAVGCDGTPMFHKKTGRVLLLGHTAVYAGDHKSLLGKYQRSTFYSVLGDNGEFAPLRFVEMPHEYGDSGNGCGQSAELADGTVLIPIYYRPEGEKCTSVAVMHCSFDGETVRFLEIGNGLCVPTARGLGEPSIIRHGGRWHMTIRHDKNGYYAYSEDGLHYSEPQLWRWDDGEILENYNTQQHWMTLGEELWLIYTRRGVNNDHVFRHRAPLLTAQVKDGRLIRETERILTPQRGARLGNFGACPIPGGAAVMAAEWMQPIGCEKYGSANAIWLTRIRL